VEPAEEQADDVTLPLLMALERLSPLERAAFVLHDVFGVSFEEIADTIDRDPAACRQLASRARTHVREARPRFPISKNRGLEIADAFFAATRGGDMEKLRSLLAEDVVVYSDGGGKVPALLEPVAGIENVMPLFESLARVFEREMSRRFQRGFINGLPGFVTVETNNTLQTTALEVDADRISAIYVVRNPEKLKHMRFLISGAGERSRV
jgi:RNA polymerase sigma-70 factor (ECF subfamily)